MRSVGSLSTSGREKEGNDGVVSMNYHIYIYIYIYILIVGLVVSMSD